MRQPATAVRTVLVHVILVISGWWLSASSALAVDFPQCFAQTPYLILLRLDQPTGCADAYVMLDTGCSYLAMDPAFGRLLRGRTHEVIAQLPVGSVRLPIRRTAAFTVEGWRIAEGLPCVVSDFSSVREAAGINIVGAIGYPAFADRIIDIDPDHAMVRILERMPEDLTLTGFDSWPLHHDAKDAGNVWVDIDCHHGHDQAFRAQVDTGDNGFMDLATPYFNLLEQAGVIRREPFGGHAAQANRITDSLVANATGDFHINAYGFPHCEMIAQDVPRIGMECIMNFRFIIDYPASIIHVKPAQTFSRFTPRVHTGLELHFLATAIEMRVSSGSDAWRCGCRDGYRLIAVDGLATHGQSAYPLRRRIERYQTSPVTLLVLDEHQRQRSIVLCATPQPAPAP